MVSSKEKLLQLLKKYSVLHGDFTLASGQKSDVYIDVRITALRSDGLVAIGGALYDAIMAIAPDVRYVGGLALGAVPITTAVAYHAGTQGVDDFHSVIVRKDAKGHGTKNLIEPATLPPAGTELIAIDDVITTAGSTIKAIDALRGAGYTINHAFAIIDRESRGAEALAEQGVRLHALYRLSEVTAP